MVWLLFHPQRFITKKMITRYCVSVSPKSLKPLKALPKDYVEFEQKGPHKINKNPGSAGS
jgi:hypothetical protein